MGNIVQCCHALSSYFKCKDAPSQGEPERSPLLSSEDSECDSTSLPDNAEDDLLTVPAGVTNPSLEPENFLFPDIILSSNLGGDVTLVEPMVCLLVSEEEEGVRADEPGDDGGVRSDGGRSSGFSEVETQTEVETQIGAGVQTQTELQTRSEVSVSHNATMEREVNTQRNEDVCTELETLKQADTLLDTQRDTELSQGRHPGKQKKRLNSETQSDLEGFVGIEVPEQDKLTSTEADKKELKGKPIHEEMTTLINHMFQIAQNTESGAEKDQGQNTECGCTSGKDENTAAAESQTNVWPIKRNNSEAVQNFDPECADLTPHRDEDRDQMVQTTASSQNVLQIRNYHKVRTADQSLLNPEHIQENTPKNHLTKGKEDTNLTSVRRVVELEAARLQVEEGAEVKRKASFSVDRMFQAGSHDKAPPIQPEESSEDGLHQPLDKSKQFSIQDIFDLQDTSFTVAIQPPGTEGFDLQVSGQLSVAELHHMLMQHETTCHRTCFSLQLGGTTLDSQSKLCSIQGIQGGARINVVEESYSVLDARLHLRHVRDLLRSLDPADAYNGVNCSSLSYLTFYTQGDKGDVPSLPVDFKPPEYILPGCKDRPLTPLQPFRDNKKPLQCLRVLTMSSWNPPPGNRKMHGDLMYLNVLTMEDKELNITSSTRGFYFNQSTAFNFNPKPAVPKVLCHSLVELVSQVSPAFKKGFSALQKKRVQQHPYERIATPFQTFTWIARQEDHSLDCIRVEETHTSCTGQEEHTAGQSRDWNEELQGCRELSRKSLQERLHRESIMFKTNSDFVEAATRGAVAVIDGNVMPLNPGEAPHMQMFIWNNLFFSLGFDISEHYHPIGGNTAAHAAALRDLRGAQAYANVDVEGLHTLGTAVVDYRGIRVIAQTIVPGILEKHQEQSVVYGSNDYGKTVFTHPRFLELLDKTSKPLRIQHHQVLDHNNSKVELCSGIETKGIVGNDSRPYILDLLRTSPPDLNFQFSATEESGEVPEVCTSLGFPRRHHHSLASLRPELTEAFVQHRHGLYVKMVTQGFNCLEEKGKSTDLQSEEAAAAAADLEVQRRNVIMKACKAVGSVSETCFDIRFNPDVCSPGVRFPSECAAEVQRQRLLLWDAAAFLLSHQIQAVLGDCLDLTAVPMDGATLTSVLHQRGVNVRYLGTLLRELDRVEDKGRLRHIQRISVSEVIIRSAKHIFRAYLQDVEPAAFSGAVSHFLNCLLSSSSCFPDSCSDELLSRRRSRRRRSQGGRAASLKDGAWTKMTPSELWSRIRNEAREYYHLTIESESMDEAIENHSLQRISLLREIAIKTGIQVQLREYSFESRHRPAFGGEDIVNMFPVVKHLKATGTDGTVLVQHARVLIRQGLLKDGYDLISQALALFSSVCGVLHKDVCTCLRLLGRLSYIMGEYADAFGYQEKAVMSSERVQGIDHPQTIQDYTHLALYCFAGGQISTSLQLLYRSRYLALLVAGQDHPHVALLDSMLGLVLHALMEFELSLKFLQSALILTSNYHGATSLKYAHIHHLLATVHESKGDFRSALRHEKEACSIYNNQVGEDHESTKDSSEYLQSLTRQAVVPQTAIKHIHSDTPSACPPSPKFTILHLPTILQQLNLTCGISVKEIAASRMEVQTQFNVEEMEINT